jgi:hypothetical protein
MLGWYLTIAKRSSSVIINLRSMGTLRLALLHLKNLRKRVKTAATSVEAAGTLSPSSVDGIHKACARE